MAQGIVSNCGCQGYVGAPTSNTNVTVDSDGILTNPLQGTFYSENDPFDYSTYSFSSTSTQVIKHGSGKLLTNVSVTLLAGVAPYVVTLNLDYINAITGAIFDVQLSFPASTNPSVILKDRQSNTQIFPTIPSSGVVSYTTVVRFVWTGSIWKFVSQV